MENDILNQLDSCAFSVASKNILQPIDENRKTKVGLRNKNIDRVTSNQLNSMGQLQLQLGRRKKVDMNIVNHCDQVRHFLIN